jgi:nitroreductase
MDEVRWSSTFISSIALGFHNMLLAATTLGLGAQWMSVAAHPVVAKQIKGLLDIPDFLEIYAMMALGYPDAKPIPKDMRETSDMVHYDLCAPTDFRTEDDLKKFFKR